MKKIILALIIVMAAASFAVADTIYLRDGRTINGTLLGFIDGRFVVRVEPRATTDSNVARRRANPGEIQYFRPEEVERIEIEGRSLEDTRFETSTVAVTLESKWIDSGIDLRRNQRVRVTASGTILVGRLRITPDGLRTTDPTAPLPQAPEGELIAAIGDDRNSPVFELGSSKEFTSDRAGRLYLTSNRGSYTDARGSFSVQILYAARNPNAVDNPIDSPRRRPGIRSRTPGVDIGRVEVTINVPGTSRGADTGIDVRAGDPIYFTASGVVTAGSRVGQVGPDGATSTGFGSVVNARPVPSAGVGALIAYIRMSNGQMSAPYLIGSQLSATVPVDGRLILLVNDDNYSDNSGSFSVRIRY